MNIFVLWLFSANSCACELMVCKGRGERVSVCAIGRGCGHQAEGGHVKELAGLCGLPPKTERNENQQALGSGAFCWEPEEKLSWEMRREEKGGGK